jgi:hypothetical protein
MSCRLFKHTQWERDTLDGDVFSMARAEYYPEALEVRL